MKRVSLGRFAHIERVRVPPRRERGCFMTRFSSRETRFQLRTVRSPGRNGLTVRQRHAPSPIVFRGINAVFLLKH